MERIVVGVDGSGAALVAARWAAEEAHRRGACLHVVHVWSGPALGGLYDQGMLPSDQLEEAAREVLERAVEAAAGALPQARCRSTLTRGDPARGLIDAARGARLLVVGAHGAGPLVRFVLGSVSDEVLHQAPCSVAIVPQPERAGGDVVVGIDGSPASVRALGFAIDEARARHARVRAVYAWSFLSPVGPPAAVHRTGGNPTARDAAAALDGALLQVDTADVAVVPMVVSDVAAHALLEHARDAALVVVGARGLGAVRQVLLGSVSRQVAHRSPVPVVVVRTSL